MYLHNIVDSPNLNVCHEFAQKGHNYELLPRIFRYNYIYLYIIENGWVVKPYAPGLAINTSLQKTSKPT